jgi:7,8-dihydropterin-6-yl-methyl-4-(beta-D-ribofuranosyl)aminobenzene 5'-phosphate synthase
VAAIPLEPVDAVAITILVDNTADLLLPDAGPARRFPGAAAFPAGVASPLLADEPALAQLRAEHGFSALVRVRKGGREHTILFDAGPTPDALAVNMGLLELDPGDVEAVVLSHGHWDHTTGLDGFARALGRAGLPVVVHPEAWSRRRILMPGRDPWLLPTTSKAGLEEAGFTIVEERRPSFLLEGAVLITGEVDRTTGFERGLPVQEAFRGGRWEPDPLTLDDQALLVEVAGKGLVVLTGCGHAGIVNTARYALRLTGAQRLYAVVGGFHLGGALFEPLVPQVVAAFEELGPGVLCPTHCTGLRATSALADAFPGAFVQSAVGTRLEL